MPNVVGTRRCRRATSQLPVYFIFSSVRTDGWSVFVVYEFSHAGLSSLPDRRLARTRSDAERHRGARRRQCISVIPAKAAFQDSKRRNLRVQFRGDHTYTLAAAGDELYYRQRRSRREGPARWPNEERGHASLSKQTPLSKLLRFAEQRSWKS